MTRLRAGLMTAAPVGPAEPVRRVVDRPDDERGEQALDLVAGERDQFDRSGVPAVLVGSDDGQERVGEHSEGDPAGPGREAADLVLVESGQAFAGLEGLLHPPP